MMKEREKCTHPHAMDDFLVEKRKQRFGHKDVLVECDLADLLKKMTQKVPLNTFCMFRSVSFLITGI